MPKTHDVMTNAGAFHYFFDDCFPANPRVLTHFGSNSLFPQTARELCLTLGEQGFQDAIERAPLDRDLRLVMAHCLEDVCEHHRAELLRIQEKANQLSKTVVK